MQKEITRPVQSINEQRLTSLEIAEITGSTHADLLKSIRKQEIAWQKVTEGNFSLSEYKDSTGRKLPMYELTQKESLYIASKFNDEARAKLVHRWFELETATAQPKQLHNGADYQENTFITKKMGAYQNTVYFTDGTLYAKFSPIVRFLYNDYTSVSVAMIEKIGSLHFRKFPIGKQDVWFTNIEGFDGFLKYSKRDIPYHKISSVYRDVFDIEKPEDEDSPFTYRFTDREMLEIIELVNRKPVSKSAVLDKLLKGKK